MRLSWAVALWPGLPQLWRHGTWAGLALAAGFGLLLNVLILCTLVWTELVGPGTLRLGWFVLTVLWCGMALGALWSGLPGHEVPGQGDGRDLFRPALDEYLRGNWIEAETLLTRLLASEAADVDARLLLASLLRHTRRHDEAERELRQIELYERGAKWQLEIATERQLLIKAREARQAEMESERAETVARPAA